jgi:hypothetical protein
VAIDSDAVGRSRRYTRAARVAAALLLLACGPAAQEPPGNVSPEIVTAPGSGVSEAGHYRLSLRPRDGEIPVGPLHAWIVTTETVQGERFAPIRLAFGGGMPQHAHGFTTEPRVTRALGLGEYLVEGVKFHMSGDWTLRLEVVGPAGPDMAIFHVQVGP